MFFLKLLSTLQVTIFINEPVAISVRNRGPIDICKLFTTTIVLGDFQGWFQIGSIEIWIKVFEIKFRLGEYSKTPTKSRIKFSKKQQNTETIFGL